MNKTNPKLVLIIGVLGISISAIFVRMSEAPSLVLATYRMMWTVLLLIPFSLKKTLPEIKKIQKKEAAIAVLAGVFFALHFTFWFESLKHTTIACSTVLVDTDVIFASVGFCIIMHGTIPKKGILAIAITVCGSILTALSGMANTAGSIFGNVLALISAVLIAAFTLCGKYIRSRNVSTSAFTLIAYTVCLLTLLILDAATGTPIIGYGIKEILIGLGMAVFCTLLGHSVLNWTLKFLSPGYVSAVKLCEPIFATILGMILFKEIPSIIQIIGAIIIISGVYIYSTVEC
ncbi:MAG: DMT family transporter [Candidatus Metalachnospira sp.]|nr:DMT family transporter [Candidatus Metalachnospira sp.]